MLGFRQASKPFVAPPPPRPVGLMLRKLSVELIMQLSELRDAADLQGRPATSAAWHALMGATRTSHARVRATTPPGQGLRGLTSLLSGEESPLEHESPLWASPLIS